MTLHYSVSEDGMYITMCDCLRDQDHLEGEEEAPLLDLFEPTLIPSDN